MSAVCRQDRYIKRLPFLRKLSIHYPRNINSVVYIVAHQKKAIPSCEKPKHPQLMYRVIRYLVSCECDSLRRLPCGLLIQCNISVQFLGFRINLGLVACTLRLLNLQSLDFGKEL